MARMMGIIVALFLVFPVMAPPVHAETSQDMTPKVASAVLIEQDTGEVLYEKNSHASLPPASMTKIMTLLLIMEQIESGKLSLDEKVRTSEYAASMGGSQIFLEVGEEMTVDELLRGIAMASANDASMALAERIAGTEEAFVEMMNKKVEELGLKDTKFQNPTGLPAKDHYSSAYDMAMMSQELLKHSLITKYTSTYEDYLRQNTDKPFWLVNTNKLVKFYPGVDGLKTGYTSEAKYCLTATAKKNDMRVIGVIMGATTPKERNAQMTKLLDFAFNSYETAQIYEKGQTIEAVKISKGAKEKLGLVVEQNVSVLLKKGEKASNITKKIKIDKTVKAPVKKGQQLGTLILKDGTKTLSETPLLAKEDIKTASFWKIFKQTFKSITKLNG